MSYLSWTTAIWLGAAMILSAPVSAQQRPAEPARIVAQVPTPAPIAPPATVQLVPEADAAEKREKLREVMRKYPPALGRVLKSDPTLLQDAAYLSRYPALAAFLGAHPEVAANPAFYLEHVYIPGDFEPQDAQSRAISLWRNIFDAFSVMVVMVFIGSMLAWLVRTVLQHRRWQRLSRVQTEVHNKLLDRFAGTGELITYVQTPAGRRFLEAAPIEVESPGRALAAPVSRILWSVQAGVILVVVGVGMLLVSQRVIPEVSEGMWLIGVLTLALGLGFVLSAAVSYNLSRRLGLFEPVAPPESATPEAGS
jgi:hypothetical protein